MSDTGTILFTGIAFLVMVAAGVAALEDGMSDPDRLAASPLPANVCPNCSGYYIGFRCESCQWTDPDAPPVTVPVDDDDASEPDAPTDLDAPDLGGSD